MTKELARDAANVGVAKGNGGNAGGYAWVGPTTATLPTDAKSEIGAEFESLGYISEDGLTNSTDAESEDRVDWSGSVIKTSQKSFSESFQASFLESRLSVLKTVYGDANVESDGQGGIAVKHNGHFTEERAYIFESLITETLIKRTVVPRGSIQERDDVSENSSDLLSYTPTIKALPDASGNTSYVYYYDSAKASAPSDDDDVEAAGAGGQEA